MMIFSNKDKILSGFLHDTNNVSTDRLETRFQMINMSDVSHWQKIKSLVGAE